MSGSIRSQNQSKKGNRKLTYLACGAVAVGAVGLAGSANAFSLSSITGLLSSFSPYVNSVLGVDISPYVAKIQSSTGFMNAVQTGNWAGASQAVVQSLGQYGVIDPAKLNAAVQANAQVKYSTTGNLNDFGLGEYGTLLNEQMTTQDALGGLQSIVNLGDPAQQALQQKGDALTQTVQSAASISDQAQQETSSLNVLKAQTGQMAAQTVVMGQLVSAIENNGLSQMRTENTLNDIRTANNADLRSKLQSMSDSAATGTNRIGTFAGMLSGSSSSSASTSSSILPNTISFQSNNLPIINNVPVTGIAP